MLHLKIVFLKRFMTRHANMVVDHNTADLMVGLLMKTWQLVVFFFRLSLSIFPGPEPDLRL